MHSSSHPHQSVQYLMQFTIIFLSFDLMEEAGEEYTGLFISPSGISELDCATTKTDTAERSISIGRESLQVFFCIRGLGILPGSTARGSREEKWRSQ